MSNIIINTILLWGVIHLIAVNLYFTPYRVNNTKPEEQRLAIDVAQSVIQWKGTKMLGLGKHEGIVKLQSGYLLLDKDVLLGGEFVIDMQTIGVTDIPENDPIPRRNLTNHLLNEDFFDVSHFPTAKLTIVQVYKQSSINYKLRANLTIKNITRSIEFKAMAENSSSDRFSSRASITINRQLWDISFKGSTLQNNLVDDDIFLEVFLKSNR